MKVDRKTKAEKSPPAVKTIKGARRAAPKTNGKHPLAAYRHIPIGIVEASLDGKYMDVNEEFCRILGYSRQELLRLGIKDCTHEDDYAIDSKLYEQLVAGKVPFYRLEKRFLRKSGGDIWVELTRTLVCDPKGKPLYTVGVVLDISDRKDVERVLRDSVERLRLATGAAHMFMWEWDFQNQSYTLDDNFEQVLGFSGGLLPRNKFETIWALSPKEDVQQISEEFERAVELQRDLHAVPYRVIHPENGQITWLEISAKVVYDDNGKPERMFGVAQNITESKKVQDEIAIISMLPAQNPNPVMRIRPEGTILYANDASAPILESWQQEAGQALPHLVQQAITEVFASGVKKEIEIGYSGNYLSCTLAPIPEGGYINLYGKDISARKKAEEALRSSEERMRLAIEASRMVAWEWDPTTDRVTTSENIADVYGMSAVEGAEAAFSLIWREDLPAHRKKVERVTREGGEYQSEFRVTRPVDGRMIWMEERATALTDEKGHVTRLVGVVTDITERKYAEEKLRESEERFRALVSQTSAGIAESDMDSRLQFVNPGFCEMLGYSEEELLGKTIWELTYTEDLEENKRLFKRLLEQGDSYQFEKRFIRKDGSLLWTTVTVTTIHDLAGNPKGGVGVVLDIEKRKDAESAIKKYTRRQEALFILSEQLHGTKSLADVYRVALDAIFSALQCSRASILLYDETNVMRFVAWRGLSDAYRSATEGHSPWTPDAMDPRPISIADIRTSDLDQSLKLVIRGEGIASLAFIPLISNGKLIGKFMVYFDIPHAYDEGEIDLSLTIARQLATGIDSKRADEDLRQSEERFRQAANASGALVYELDLISGTSAIVHGLESLTGYDPRELSASSDWWHSLIHPEDLPTHLAQLETLLNTGGSDVCEYRVKHRNGNWIVVQDNRLIIQDGAGQFLRLVGAVIDITERKRIEEALRIENERFMRFVNSNIVGILIADPTGKVVLANDYYLNLLGLTRQDLAEGKVDWRKFTPPEWLPADEKAIRELRETGVCEPYEKEYVRADGTRVPVYLADAMLPGPGEEIAAFAIDITERKRAEESLRRNEELFSTLMEAAPFGVYFIDSEFRLRAINKGSEEVFRGIEPLIGRDFAEVLRIVWQEPFATEAIERFRHTLRTGESYISPPSVEKRENIEEIQAYDWQIHRIILPDGSFGVVCYFYDLSEQKRLEAAVRESEERFRNMADHAPVMVWVTDANGHCTYLSQSWYEFTGQTPETGLGEGWLGVVHPDDSESSQKIFSTANKKREAFRLEYRLRDKSSEYHWAIDSAQPRFSENGEFLGFIGSVIDITERKRAEEALRKSEERYRGIVNQTIGGIAETDLTGKFVMVNDRYCEIVGYTREKLLNEMRMQDITHPDDQTRNMELFKCLSSDGDSFEIEKRYVRPDGSLVWVHNSVSAITSADGKPQSAVAAVIDITERRLAEEHQRRSAEFDAFRVALVDALRLPNDPEEILAEALQVLGEKLDVDRVLFSEIAEDDETILILDNYVKEGVPKLTGRASLSDYGKARGLLSRGQNLIVVDAAISPDMDETDQESFAALGIRSGIGIPLIKAGRWAATLGVHHSSMRIWTQNEVRFMEETAERTWSALERARAQEKLRASETLYRAIARNIPGGGVYVVDKDFRYLVAEGPVTDAFGLSRDMFEGRTVTDVFPDERGAQIMERLQRNFAGETVGFETNFNGRVYWTQQAPLLDSIGQAIILTLDITERKQAEEALRQSEERFARFMQQLPGLAWIKDIDGRYVYANAAAEKAFNTPREELYGKTDEDIFSPEVAAQFRNNDVQALQDEKGIQVIETLEQADGVLHYSLVSKFPIPGPDGHTTLIGGTAFDITERLKAEDALRESEERFRALLRQATAGIVRKDAEGRLIFVNQAFCNMLGHSEAELLGKTMWDFMHEEDVAESTSSYERLMQEGIPFKLERRLRREDGSIIWVDASVSPIMDSTGRPHSAVAVEVDITARKQAEEALQQLNLQLEERVLSRTERLRSVNQTLREEITERKKIEDALRKSEAAARENEEKLSTLFRLLPVGISFLDPQGQILEMNPALANMLKLSDGHLADQSYRSRNYIRANGSLMPPTEFASRRALTEGKTIYNVETGVILEDGDVVWTSVSAAPVDVADVGVVVVTADITESKRAERALQESRERLQILSQRLVEVQEEERRSIARELHDRVGQTLAALNINLIIISGQLGGKVDEQVSTRLNDSMKLVAETIALVRDVMSNLRPSVLDDYGLEAAIESHLSGYRSRYEINTKFERPTSPIPRLGPSIEMTFLRIAQEALMNSAKHAQASQVTLRLEKEGNAVRMIVEDNGMGIESWQEANRPGSHGLTIMRERAEAFGGTLRVSSAPGKGTKVEVNIPIENTNPPGGRKR